MNPWLVLGVDPSADAGAVRAAYHRLARQHHPDHGGSTAQMREINAAYGLLDATLRAASNRSTGAGSSADPAGCSGARAASATDARPAASWSRRARSWLAGSRPGQWLTSLVILMVVHQVAVAAAIGAPSFLETLVALLALSLQAAATPAGQAFAPGRDALALAVLMLRAAFWCADQW